MASRPPRSSLMPSEAGCRVFRHEYFGELHSHARSVWHGSLPGLSAIVLLPGDADGPSPASLQRAQHLCPNLSRLIQTGQAYASLHSPGLAPLQFSALNLYVSDNAESFTLDFTVGELLAGPLSWRYPRGPRLFIEKTSSPGTASP